MAGLVCAARARELGLAPRVIEKGTRAGRLDAPLELRRSGGISTGTTSARECPGGDEALQRLIWERLDDALDWLVSLGAEPVWEDTENPRTTGKRFDPRALTRAARARRRARDAAARRTRSAPLVLATGGFRGAARAEQRGLLLRANPWSDGAGLDYATRARRRASRRAWTSSTAARMPAPPARIREEDFVPLVAALRPLGARLHRRRRRHHAARRSRGTRTISRSAIGAGAPGTSLDDDGLEHGATRRRCARGAAATVRRRRELPFETPPGRASPCTSPPAVTHTIGGLRVDTRARVERGDRRRLRRGRRRGRRRDAAATRAASRRRSCSASPRRKTLATARRADGTRTARLSPGSGDGRDLRDAQRARRPARPRRRRRARRRRARAARSRTSSRRRGGSRHARGGAYSEPA